MKREYWAVAGLFLCLLLLYFYRCIFLGDYFSPAEMLKGMAPWTGVVQGGHSNSLRSDDVFLAFPLYATHLDALRSGQLPFWDPWKLGGALGGMMWVSLGQILYPLSMLFWLEPQGSMLVWFAILRLFVGGLGMWALLRRLAVSNPGAILAGVAYMLNIAFIAWLSSPIPSVMVWLPWAVLAIESLIVSPGLASWAGLALVGGFQFLAGYIAESFVFVAVAGSYALIRLLQSARELQPLMLVKRLGLLLTAGFATAFVGALGLIPSLSSLSNSGMAARGAGLDYLPLLNAVSYLDPNFFGNPVHNTWWSGSNYCEVIQYLGLLPLFFALYAAIFAWRKGRTLLFLLPLLVIGGYLFGAPVLHDLGRLPGFYQTATTRWTSAIAFMIAGLAGLGWDLAVAHPRKTLGRWGAFMGVAAAAVALALHAVWPQLAARGLRHYAVTNLELMAGVFLLATPFFWRLAKRGRLTPGLSAWAIAIAVLDLGVAGADFNPTTPAKSFYPSTPGLVRLQKDATLGRILPYDGLFPGDMAGLYGLRSLGGYDLKGDVAYRRFLYEAGDRSFPPEKTLTPNAYLLPTLGAGYASPNELWLNVDPRSPLLDLMAVRHFLLSPNGPAAPSLAVSYAGSDLRIVDNPHARPWAWWTPLARVVTDDEAYALMRQAPRGGPKEALLAQAPVGVSLSNPGQGAVLESEQKVDAFSARFDASSPGFVMISQRHHPGWQAFVDGRPVPLLRADAILSAVPVPAGRHELRLEFRDPVAVGSFWVSLLSMLLGLGLLLISGLRKRKVRSCQPGHGILGA